MLLGSVQGLCHATNLGSKGFLGRIGHRDTKTARTITSGFQSDPVSTHKLPLASDRWLNRICERIEGTLHEVQNAGRNVDRLLRKNVIGLTMHVMAKMTCHAFPLVLPRFSDIDIQSFMAYASI